MPFTPYAQPLFIPESELEIRDALLLPAWGAAIEAHLKKHPLMPQRAAERPRSLWELLEDYTRDLS